MRITCWREGRGQSAFLSLEMWHIANENHLLEGRKRSEHVHELGNMTCHKQGLTEWRGGRGRSAFVSLEMWHVTNEDSLTGGEEEG